MKERSNVCRSLGAKAALAIVLIALVLSGTAVAFSYHTYKVSLEEQLIHTAANVGRTMAAQVDPDSIDHYLETGERDAAYEETLSRLRTIQKNNDIVYAVVTKPTEEGFYYIYDTDESEDAIQLGHLGPYYEGAFLDHKADFLAGGEIPPIISNEEFGWLLSALVPIKDADGHMRGYVDVDMSMNEIIQMQHAFLLRSIVLLAAVSVVLVVLSILAARQVLVKPIDRLAEATGSFVRRQQDGLPAEDAVMDLPGMETGDEVERLYRSIRQMEQDICAYIDDITAITAEKERIGAELSVATEIQSSMLPCIFPPYPDRPEFSIYATMTPAKEVGGDFYDFFLVDDDHLATIIADVSGKGVPAALFMVIAKVLLKNSAQTGKSPKEVLEEVNSQLCANNPVDMFVTVWIGILELSTGKLICANAGHEYPAIRRAGGGYELFKDKHGFVLAGMDGSRYREYELDLAPGDEIFVYTDGVAEATDTHEELFGTDRMIQALNSHPDAAPEELLPLMKADIDAFVGKAPQFDDITMLDLRYHGPKAPVDGQ